MTRTTIVGVAGPIAAGKSELAKTLVTRGIGTRASFSGYVRGVAEARGLAKDRDELQRLGEELLAELGAVEFTQRALAGYSGDLVVDGVRHVAVSDALAARARRYVLVFVDLDERSRQARLAERGESVDTVTLDAHSTERDVAILRQRADLIVSGDAAAAVGRVVEFLAHGNCSPSK